MAFAVVGLVAALAGFIVAQGSVAASLHEPVLLLLSLAPGAIVLLACVRDRRDVVIVAAAGMIALLPFLRNDVAMGVMLGFLAGAPFASITVRRMGPRILAWDLAAIGAAIAIVVLSLVWLAVETSFAPAQHLTTTAFFTYRVLPWLLIAGQVAQFLVPWGPAAIESSPPQNAPPSEGP